MISISGLHLTYRDAGTSHAALRGVSIEVAAGEFLALLGPSGCGKTTLLRCIAGLNKPDQGRISIGGETVYSSNDGIDVPVRRRDIGMVFQSYAIWPHMTVAQNASFPLRYRRSGMSAGEIRERTAECLRLVHLDEFADRPAPALSGGQQQRLALARALISQPKVLLLDEPLSNLDARLREEMRFELRALTQTARRHDHLGHARAVGSAELGRHRRRHERRRVHSGVGAGRVSTSIRKRSSSPVSSDERTSFPPK